MKTLAVTASLLLLASGASAQTAGPVSGDAPARASTDWGRALAEDAQALHDVIAGSHPGPVDPENPAFNQVLERGLTLALDRAKTAHTYEDWYFALQQYANGFDDGHLTLTGYAPNDHAWRMEWPGFLTARQGDADTVVFNRDPAAPPLGARLVSCDGEAPDALAQRIIGLNVGRWALKSTRAIYSNTLFVDQSNLYVARPETCVFDVEGVSRSYALSWRVLDNASRDEGLAKGRNLTFVAPIGLRAWGDDGFWIGMGSFEAGQGTPQAAALTVLDGEVRSRAEALREARTVVFDLRGNGGGSSIWGSDIARTLWGDDWVGAHAPRSAGVDWRASQGNLDEISSYRAQFAGNPTMTAWIDAVEGGLKGAREAGRPLWRQGGETAPVPEAAPPAPTTAMHARVYVLTDYNCASACLDTLDLLKALGATQIGQETSADTLYMNAREQALPGGRVSVVVPMKVYRGRARGNNQTVVPEREWTGALADTAGIEAWIGELSK
jgi:hypothetical protein